MRLRVVTRMPVTDTTGERQRRFLALSLALHVAFIIAVIIVPPIRQRPRINPDAIAVTLTGAMPGPETVVQRAAPVPEPTVATPDETAPEGASLEQQQVKIQKKPAVRKKPVEKPPEQAPTPRRNDDPAEKGGSSAPASAGGAPGAATAGGSVASLDLENVEFAWYGSSVTASLRSNWLRPPLVNVHDVLSVIVAFEILRDGSVRNLRIENSSGVRSLDRSALRAVTDAVPLPPLPPNLGSSSLPARFEFRWYPGSD